MGASRCELGGGIGSVAVLGDHMRADGNADRGAIAALFYGDAPVTCFGCLQKYVVNHEYRAIRPGQDPFARVDTLLRSCCPQMCLNVCSRSDCPLR